MLATESVWVWVFFFFFQWINPLLKTLWKSEVYPTGNCRETRAVSSAIVTDLLCLPRMRSRRALPCSGVHSLHHWSCNRGRKNREALDICRRNKNKELSLTPDSLRRLSALVIHLWFVTATSILKLPVNCGMHEHNHWEWPLHWGRYRTPSRSWLWRVHKRKIQLCLAHGS